MEDVSTPVLGVLVCASLSLGSGALALRKGVCWGRLWWCAHSRMVCVTLAVPNLDNKSGMQKPTVQSVCEHSMCPAASLQRAAGVLDALKCSQKHLMLYQPDHFQGLQCRFYICSPAHGRFSPGRTSGHAPGSLKQEEFVLDLQNSRSVLLQPPLICSKGGTTSMQACC